MILSVLKASVGDIWEEILFLVIFNFIWLIGTVLILPWPFVTFGLFFTVHDIGQGKGIHFSTFFAYGRDQLKPAYIWGGINLLVIVALVANILFYGNLFAQSGAQWSAFVRILMIGFLFVWSVLQLVALPLYPRLENPTFRLATRNAAILVGRHPGSVFALLIISGIIGLISAFFPAIAFLGGTAFVAIVANRMIGALIQMEVERSGQGPD